jgi:hypothetical protein
MLCKYIVTMCAQVTIQIAIGKQRQDASAGRAQEASGVRTGRNGRHDRGTVAGNTVHSGEVQLASSLVQTENLFVPEG